MGINTKDALVFTIAKGSLVLKIIDGILFNDTSCLGHLIDDSQLLLSTFLSSSCHIF